jgi:GMP synthase-like glutamine amidotransferase
MRTLVLENDRLCPLGGLAGPLRRAGAVDVWRPGDDGAAPSLDAYDAVVALGGGQSPRDDARHAWLADERALLSEAMSRRLGVLGVCLGGQLIAQVLGADVGRLPTPEVRWARLDATPAADADPLLSHIDGAPVLQWHSFGFAAPADGILLAGAPERAAAFRHGSRAWALQFHVEVTEALLGDWIDHYGDELPGMGVDAAALRHDTAAHAPAQRRTAARVADAFVHAVAGRDDDR